MFSICKPWGQANFPGVLGGGEIPSGGPDKLVGFVETWLQAFALTLHSALQMVMSEPSTAGEELWLEFQDPLLESRFLPVQQAALAQVCDMLASRASHYQTTYRARRRVVSLVP